MPLNLDALKHNHKKTKANQLYFWAFIFLPAMQNALKQK
jgi:hypothetical protein